MKKTWIKVKRGLLEPEHREKLGIRIWLYLYIVDIVDWETGTIKGWKDQEAADELGMELTTVRKQRRQLIEDKYISCSAGFQSQNITVLKWSNPRYYDGSVINDGDQKETVTNNGHPQCPTLDTHPIIELDTPTYKPQFNHINTHSSAISKSEIADPIMEPCDDDGLPIKEKPKSKKSTRDPRTDHPAIMSYRSITGKYPNKLQYDAIIQAIGESPNLPKLQACWKEWAIERGYHAGSIKWITEWYRTGIPKNGGKQQQMSAADQQLQRAREEGLI